MTMIHERLAVDAFCRTMAALAPQLGDDSNTFIERFRKELGVETLVCARDPNLCRMPYCDFPRCLREDDTDA